MWTSRMSNYLPQLINMIMQPRRTIPSHISLENLIQQSAIITNAFSERFQSSHFVHYIAHNQIRTFLNIHLKSIKEYDKYLVDTKIKDLLLFNVDCIDGTLHIIRKYLGVLHL